jgi:hypothetical protein
LEESPPAFVVPGTEAIKRAIRALPGFFPSNGHRKAQHVHMSAVEPDLPNPGVDPRLSREQLDRLCKEILDPPVEE